MRRRLLTSVSLFIFLAAGCKSGSGGGLDLSKINLNGLGGSSSGGSSAEQAVAGGIKTAQAVGKASEEFTPEQEYYIGRAFTAEVLHRYPPFADPAANQYLNEIGAALANASDLPDVFSGYHFVVLDSDDINAFAAPGAFICVTRGMLRCCPSEDCLAAVLAHEIGHVEHGDGLRVIKNSRWWNAATVAGVSAASAADRNAAALTESFGGLIDDMTNQIIVKGYGRDLEKQADLAAVILLSRVGYDPHALVTMLQEMQARLKPGGLDFGKTHPKPADRIKAIQAAVDKCPPAAPAPPERQARFDKALQKAIAP